MALIPCKSCGNMIAKDTQTCPNCGTKNKRGSSYCGVLVVGFIAFIAFCYGIGSYLKPPQGYQPPQEVNNEEMRAKQEAEVEKKKLAAMTPAERDDYQREKLKKEFEKKFRRPLSGMIKPVAYYVQDNMKNPKSFEHVKTTFSPKPNALGKYIVKMTYRGANSFGAIVTEQVAVIVNQEGKILGPAD